MVPSQNGALILPPSFLGAGPVPPRFSRRLSGDVQGVRGQPRSEEHQPISQMRKTDPGNQRQMLRATQSSFPHLIVPCDLIMSLGFPASEWE